MKDDRELKEEIVAEMAAMLFFEGMTGEKASNKTLKFLKELQEYRQKIEDGELVSKDWHDEQVMFYKDRYEELQQKIEQGRLIEPKKASLHIVEFDFFNCSNCGCQMPSGAGYTQEAEEMLKQGKHYNYCPNCGAELRGGK